MLKYYENIMEDQNLEAEKKNICCHHRKPFCLVVIIALLLISCIFWIGADVKNKIKEGEYIGQPPEQKNTITVSDSAEIYAKPDLAITTFSVVTEAKTVEKAMSENTQKMNAIVDSIKKLGIKETDLKTTNFSISPRYEWEQTKPCTAYSCPPGKRVLVGYEVNQSLEVKIRDMEKIGDVVQAATDEGANEVGNLEFTIEKEDELKKQAREEAITKVKTKAKELAEQLGVDLVKITNFSESGEVPQWRYYEKMAAEGIGGGGEAAPSIQTGQNKISVTVSITYEIN